MKSEQEIFRECELICRMFDGNMEPEGIRAFEKRLSQDSDFLDIYAQVAEVHGHLICPGVSLGLKQQSTEEDAILSAELWQLLLEHEKAAPELCLLKEEPERKLVQKVVYPKTSHRISKLSIFSVAVNIAAVILIALFVKFAPVKHENTVVGMLSDSIGAKWENVSGDLIEGCDLYTGPMKLESGYAKINMNKGAVIIVQAPSCFTLESANQVFVQEGRVVVRVDSKNDTTFMVRSPQATIVDYGTEFGVQVKPSETLTHVYQGCVELRSGSNPLRYAQPLRLNKNQGGKVDQEGNVESQEGISGLFVRSEGYAIKKKAVNGSAYHRWLDYSLDLREDPDLVAYYTFERDSTRSGILVNQAQSSRGALNAELSGRNGSMPQWSQGRFSQKSALTFDASKPGFAEVASDERLSLNGPITLAAWVYCESAEDGGHIVSNRTASVMSPCNYQLGYRGKEKERKQYIHMARKLSGTDDKNQINSKPLPDDLTGWILVAATHDNQTLKYYINGALFDTQSWPQKNDVIEAGLRIGSDFRTHDESSFNGKIDEIAILQRVMSEREIAEMYKAGKP